MFNAPTSIEAQRKYCEDNKAPHFAPRSGRCWSCGRNIYEEYKSVSFYSDHVRITGITTEKAANSLVTGCPHCNRSYCD